MKNLTFYLIIALLVSGIYNMQGQNTDLARIEYTYFPQSDSDNSFRRFRTFANFPIKLKKEGSYLFPGIEYENINFKYEDKAPVTGREDLDRYQSFTASLGYTFKMQKNWRFAATAGVMLASNFELGEALNDDLLYTGSVFFIKDENGEETLKPWRLILGLHYSTTSGMPFPLPVVNYYREISPNWSYSAGVPKSNLKYSFNEKHHLQLFATLDGFFANIQNNRVMSTTGQVAENISMTIVLGGIGYEYNFIKHLVYYLYAGHTIMNDIRLRDGDKDDVYEINKTNTFYGRSGIKFKI
ncbi:DUF6268 family outer membrane beta-barrel protein [Salinimicrobium sp. MT39]|uniref:DUF6268 family outer membrane beta-barrel protein n=1 Tax=Salinimicrobium profundisediminis TaxID=2994553 RepID=A0A9X3I1V7_9FLAO|nr:DUF6268 family outer membrane beta-barrel protein [Salinimicrobium profundisediminis]MCX2839361.1 DUF6268 family outer membrane beta-barrel protein [Salinimicrobium profundisediminis]